MESWPTGGSTDSSILCLRGSAELTQVSSQQAGFSGVIVAPVDDTAGRPGEVAKPESCQQSAFGAGHCPVCPGGCGPA